MCVCACVCVSILSPISPSSFQNIFFPVRISTADICFRSLARKAGTATVLVYLKIIFLFTLIFVHIIIIITFIQLISCQFLYTNP